jgi:TRAP-type C4-dicarboxylate transport system permease small subunit
VSHVHPPDRDGGDGGDARQGGVRPEDLPQRPAGPELEALQGRADAVEAEREPFRHMPAVFRLIDAVLKTVMAVLLLVLVVAVGANVFGRFVLNQSLAGSDELARFLFIWVIFLGAALAHLHNEHIAVGILTDRLRPSVQRWFVVVQELVILVVVIALLMGAAEVLSIDPGTSALLDVPLVIVNFAVPFAAGLMGMVTLYRLGVALRPSPGRVA